MFNLFGAICRCIQLQELNKLTVCMKNFNAILIAKAATNKMIATVLCTCLVISIEQFSSAG